MSKGYFISIEGGDGSGKSTQIKKMVSYLEEKGYSVVVTREPGGTPIAEAIRNIILNPAYSHMTARTEMLLYAASRAQHVEEKILPALSAGKIVLSDRFTDSSIAYQAYGRDLGDMVRIVNEIATAGLKPDLTIYLALSAADGIARKQAQQQHSLDRMELETQAFHERVAAGYEALCQAEPARICRIDAGQEIKTVFSHIRSALDVLLS